MNIYEKIKWAAIGGVSGGSAIILHDVIKRRYTPPMVHMKSIGEVKKLYIHPLLGGGRMEIEDAECTEMGLTKTIDGFTWTENSFVVYTSDYRTVRTVFDLRRIIMMRMQPVVGGMFRLYCGNQRIVIRTPQLTDEKGVSIRMFVGLQRNLHVVKCWDCGDDVASFISSVTRASCTGLRLGYIDDETKRHIFHLYTPENRISQPLCDLSDTVHLVTNNWLESFREDINHLQITEQFWRPNLFVELGFKDVVFRNRISIINIDWFSAGEAIFKWEEDCACDVCTDHPFIRTGIKRLRDKRQEIPFAPRHLRLQKPGRISNADHINIPSYHLTAL